MDAVKVEPESNEEATSVPPPTEYGGESHEEEPLPFLFAAVKTEIEVSYSVLCSLNVRRREWG
jgi:hypothetical protein